MQKIGDVTDTATADGEFTDGSVAGGISPTLLLAAIFNTWQREMCNIVTGAGMELDSTDDGQLLKAIQLLVSNSSAPDVNELYITASDTDPNVKWPGTTWNYLGEGLTLRTAKADFSDLGTTIGADSVTLSVSNMPGHTHAFSATTGDYDFAAVSTSSFDYGTKTSSSNGDHTHTVDGYNEEEGDKPNLAGASGSETTTVTTSSSGAHTHTTNIGAHSHTIDLPSHSHSINGTTASTGSASAISMIQKSVMIAVWVRVA
ncbi:hypothetical protein AU577_20400 [Salmonella enterica subsp. enterica serovar Alachua]|nr:hypothetical protein [Salmonella enterica subsp. enterica serovar Alachua]